MSLPSPIRPQSTPAPVPVSTSTSSTIITSFSPSKNVSQTLPTPIRSSPSHSLPGRSSLPSSLDKSLFAKPMDVEITPPISVITLGEDTHISGLAESLCQHAVSKRSQDNVSCLIIFLEKEKTA